MQHKNPYCKLMWYSCFVTHSTAYKLFTKPFLNITIKNLCMFFYCMRKGVCSRQQRDSSIVRKKNSMQCSELALADGELTLSTN